MVQVDSTPPPQANPPLRRGARVPGPVETLVLGWRWLRRMRTALYLLGVVALASLLATLVPQDPNVPDTVDAWLAGTEGPGQTWAALLDAIGAYDVYGTPWFLLLVVLLFVSLTACLIPRYRAWWRLVRRSRPPRSRDLAAQPHVAWLVTDRPPDEALEVARRALRRRRWRLRAPDADPQDAPPQVAAERGHVAREGGSLLFHSAFYLLLVGIVGGQLLGFTGQVGIVEGKSWAETAVGYWAYLPGRMWDEGDHRGFVMTLDRFEVDWHENGQPSLFRSYVSFERPDGSRFERHVAGNDPAVVDGMKIHQLDWGYAPRIVVTVDGEVVHDRFVELSATEGTHWHGAVKAPAADPDVGLDVYLVPNAPDGPDGRPQPTTWPGADNPLLIFTLYRGDLRMDRVQSIAQLDTTGLFEVTGAGLRPGFEVALPDGVVVAMPEIRRWVGFQISHRPTGWLLLLAGALVLTGLLPALYAYRRRLWVEASHDVGERRTVVIVAGRAFQRSQAFEAEHDAFVAALAADLAAQRFDHEPPQVAGSTPHDPEFADTEVAPR